MAEAPEPLAGSPRLEPPGERRLWERLGEMAHGHAEVATAVEKVAAFAYETRTQCDRLEARLAALGAVGPPGQPKAEPEEPSQAKLQAKAPQCLEEVTQVCEQLSLEVRAKMDKLRVDIVAEMRGDLLRALREDIAFSQQSILAASCDARASAGAPVRGPAAAGEAERENAPPPDALCGTANISGERVSILPFAPSTWTVSTPRCVGAPVAQEDGRRGSNVCRRPSSGQIGDLRSAGDLLSHLRLQQSKALQSLTPGRQGPWREDSMRSLSSARSSDGGPSTRLLAQPTPPQSARIQHGFCAAAPHSASPCRATPQAPRAQTGSPRTTSPAPWLASEQEPRWLPQPLVLQGAAVAGAAAPGCSPAAVQLPQLPLAQLTAQQPAPEQLARSPSQPGPAAERPVQHPEVQPPQPEQMHQPQQELQAQPPHQPQPGTQVEMMQQPPTTNGSPSFVPAAQQPGGGGQAPAPQQAQPQAQPQPQPQPQGPQLVHYVQVGPNVFAAQPLQQPQQRPPQWPPSAASAPCLAQKPPQMVPLSPQRQPPCSPEAAKGGAPWGPSPPRQQVLLLSPPGSRPMVRQVVTAPAAAPGGLAAPGPTPRALTASHSASSCAAAPPFAASLAVQLTRGLSPETHRCGSGALSASTPQSGAG